MQVVIQDVVGKDIDQVDRRELLESIYDPFFSIGIVFFRDGILAAKV